MKQNYSKNISKALAAILIINASLPAFAQNAQATYEQLTSRLCMGDIRTEQEVMIAFKVCDTALVQNYYNHIRSLEDELKNLRAKIYQNHEALGNDPELSRLIGGTTAGFSFMILAVIMRGFGATTSIVNLVLFSGGAIMYGSIYRTFTNDSRPEALDNKLRLDSIRAENSKLYESVKILEKEIQNRKANLNLILKQQKLQKLN